MLEILFDDRLILRKAIKEGNEDIINILNEYIKKSSN